MPLQRVPSFAWIPPTGGNWDWGEIPQNVPRRAPRERVGADRRAVDFPLSKGFVFNESVFYALQGEVDT